VLASTVVGSSVDNPGLAAMVAGIVNDSLAASSPETSWPTVWTVGHSTRSAAELNYILDAHEIGHLADVRSFPGSRRYPQFNGQQLSESLPAIGINYHHLPNLGGRRRPLSNSRNIAWKNQSFRAYADYMDTEGFLNGIRQLLELATEQRTAIMCAEALWWRCHRSLIADYLKLRSLVVIHVMDATHTQIHPYTSAARIIHGRLSYEGLLGE
jgi:uncharacterized protein (DUF488 family)